MSRLLAVKKRKVTLATDSELTPGRPNSRPMQSRFIHNKLPARSTPMPPTAAQLLSTFFSGVLSVLLEPGSLSIPCGPNTFRCCGGNG